MTPMLLSSPPGVGKTRLCRTLGAIFDVPLLYLDMSSETNGSALAGSSTFYSNSSPGRLFETLAWDSVHRPAAANPLVVLDEVDKVGGGPNGYNPLAALFRLLERDTASDFEDQALPGVHMDASLVRFILCANDTTPLPAAILSRVMTFEIQQPPEDELIAALRQMWAEVIVELNLNMTLELSDALIADLRSVSLREARVRLEACAALAAAAGMDHIDATHWTLTARRTQSRQKAIGFI